MENLTLNRTRVSVLWLLAMISLFGYATLAANEVPENFNNLSLVTDQDVASVSVVLVVFAFLSLTLKGSANRWTNTIAGSILGIGTLAAFIDGVTVNLYGIYNPLMGAVFVSMSLVVWFAYKTPKSQA